MTPMTGHHSFHLGFLVLSVWGNQKPCCGNTEKPQGQELRPSANSQPQPFCHMSSGVLVVHPGQVKPPAAVSLS
jgi:hypothetical protein